MRHKHYLDEDEKRKAVSRLAVSHSNVISIISNCFSDTLVIDNYSSKGHLKAFTASDNYYLAFLAKRNLYDHQNISTYYLQDVREA